MPFDLFDPPPPGWVGAEDLLEEVPCAFTDRALELELAGEGKRLVGEGLLAGEEDREDDADGPDVAGGGMVPCATNDFGRGVRVGAAEGAVQDGSEEGVFLDCRAKVDDFDLTVSERPMQRKRIGLTLRYRSITMFSSFKSRWYIPLRCRYDTADTDSQQSLCSTATTTHQSG